MDGKNQFLVFCVCVAVGFVGGLPYELVAIVRLLFACEKNKNKPLGIMLDILFFISFAATCVAAAYFFKFPPFRAYMWLGYACGGIIYSKILRRIVAIPEKICYNAIIKAVKRFKGKKKPSKKGRKIYDTRQNA